MTFSFDPRTVGIEPSEWTPAPQPPCPCCGSHTEGLGCVGPADLPADWRERGSDPEGEPWALAACSTEGCACWGGPDRECEDCWLSSK